MKPKKGDRFLSLLISSVLVFTTIPAMSVTAYAARERVLSAPTSDGKNIYGNGSALVISGTDAGTTVYWDKNRNGMVDSGDLSLKSAGISGAPNDGANLFDYTIYGGSKSATVNGNTLITMTGGYVDSIFGGGEGAEGAVALINGSTVVRVSGGTVSRNIAGGGNINSSVSGTADVMVTGGSHTHVDGGGLYNSNVAGKASIFIQNATVMYIYGAGSSNCSVGSVEITFGNGTKVTDLLKVLGNNNCTVTGTKKVNVQGNITFGKSTTIDLSTLTGQKVYITGALTGEAGDITLINPSATTDGTVVATASSAAHADSSKFTLSGKSLYNEGVNIKIGTPYTLTFDDQGGSGGNGTATGNSGTAIPASVTVPKRLGYTFGGYYTAANGGGEKYYDASGARNGTINFTGSRNIFASWIVKTSTLTLNPAGGAISGSTDVKTETKNYSETSAIPTPAREGHTFLGWRVENERDITDPATDKHGSYDKTANKFTFGTVDATMTALWLAQSNVDYDVVDGTGSGSLLDGSLGTIVTDDKGGVTEEDVAEGNTVSLKLTVAEKAVTDAPSSDLIEEIKQGDSVQYYDVKVEKTVTTQGGGETTTMLTTTPKPVRAIIPIPQGIQGRTSYAVYRIHEGIASAIPADPAAPEYYEVNSGGTTLTLHVRKFSTYAVVTGDKSLSGSGNLGGDNGTNSADSGMDVQGKILEGTLGTYKLDISWGAMKFDFNAAGMVWNPDTHSYTPGGTQGWTNESFEQGNNKITVANHSNGDVLLGYLAVPNTSLSGVTMTVHSTNSLEGIEAEDILLEKVPTESAEAPTVDTYVWLSGTPTDLVTLTKESYTKAGVITVTAAADMTSGLTPKNP